MQPRSVSGPVVPQPLSRLAIRHTVNLHIHITTILRGLDLPARGLLFDSPAGRSPAEGVGAEQNCRHRKSGEQRAL